MECGLEYGVEWKIIIVNSKLVPISKLGAGSQSVVHHCLYDI